MHRELLSNPYVGSYPAMLLLALVAGYVLLRWRCVRLGIAGASIDTMVLLIAAFSLVGARFFSWWFYFPPGAPLWPALVTRGAGLVFYGGLIFGTATVIVYCRLRHLSMGDVLDACAPALALGLGIGRVGCFLGGCCWGDVCIPAGELSRVPLPVSAWQLQTFPEVSGPGFPLAVEFPPGTGAYEQHERLGLISAGASHSQPVHPVQLYEAVLAIGLCCVLHWAFGRRKWRGQIAYGLTVGYAIIRFTTEFFRADNNPVYAGLTISQVVSIALVASAVACSLWVKTSQNRAVQRPVVPQPVTVDDAHSPATHETQS
jgi:phosphatidylglycerol:prolipoprotein diacylglycerol transferase